MNGTPQAYAPATPIYVVTTEGDCEGRSTKTVGYASGNEKDIRALYAEKQNYTLTLTPIKVVHATPELVARRAELRDNKRDLEEQLAALDKELAFT
jgi:hypothetical protein